MKYLGLWVSFLLVVMLAIPVLAADADDYEYRVPVTITNNSGSTLNSDVCVQINPPALIAAGYLDATAGQAAGFTVGDVELDIIRQGLTTATACWWIETGSIADTNSVTHYIHMLSDTPAADIAQGWTLTTVGATAPDDATLDVTNNLTVHIEDAVFSADEAGWVDIASKSAVYYFQKGTGAAGSDYRAHVALQGGGCPSSLTATASTATLDTGTTYDLTMTYESAGGTSTLLLYRDGVQVASANSGVSPCTIQNSANPFAVGPMAGTLSMASLYVGDTSVSTPTKVLEWDFEPANVELTQTGAAANGWQWVQQFTDSAGSNDGQSTRVLDLSNVTVEAGPIASKALIPFTSASAGIDDVLGVFPDLDVVEATGVFTGLNDLEAAVDFAGGANDGIFMLLMVLGGSALGGLVIRLTRYPALGVIVLGVIVFLGAPFGWYGWAWVTIAELICFGVGGLMALRGKN